MRFVQMSSMRPTSKEDLRAEARVLVLKLKEDHATPFLRPPLCSLLSHPWPLLLCYWCPLLQSHPRHPHPPVSHVFGLCCAFTYPILGA